MTVEIKITFNQLSYMNDCFAEMETTKESRRETKITQNILQNLHKKLLKKTISKIGTVDKFKLTLEYYEAHFLEQYLMYCMKQISKYEHIHNSIQSIINDLNQKLA